MSIRVRLTLLYALVLSTMLLIFGGVLYGVVRLALYSEVDQSLREQANARAKRLQLVLDEIAAQEAGTASGSTANLTIGTLDTPERSQFLVELRWLHQPLVMPSRNLGQSQLPVSDVALDRAHQQNDTTESVLFEDEPFRIYTLPVVGTDGQPLVVVRVARSLVEIERNLRLLALVLSIGGIITTASTVLAGAWLADKALVPVDNVTRAALHVSRAEDLSSRLPEYRSRDEIGRLIAAFNEMLGRLEDVFRNQQRFVADVSHELRTPLTALQGHLDLIKRGAYSPDEQAEAIATLESEVERLNRLVSDLLLLARADGGEQMVHERVELDTLLLEVFRQGRVLADASPNSVRLRLGHEDQATVVGDNDRLRQLFLNLVANAIDYTPEGDVVLSLWKDREAGQVRVTVEDTGMGIAEESIPLLFHRFYRADKARSRQKGGTGLGLAIAQWIARAHDGNITVESQEGVGSTFTVTLPLPTAEALASARPITGGHRTISRP